MIRVCHVTSMHPPFDRRIFEKECMSTAKKYETYLIAGNIDSQDYKGYHIIGVPMPASRIKRMLTVKPILKKMMEVNADIYHFHDPELLSVGLKMKKLGKKIVFDSHENYPFLILTKLWIPFFIRRPLSSLYNIYEKRCLRQYDAVISVTPFIVRRLKAINPNVYQITNYPILEEFVDNRKWERSVCFAGGITKEWMHENIINGISLTSAKYALAGDATDDYLKQLKSFPNWMNVEYKGRIPRNMVESFLQMSTAALCIYSYEGPNGNYKEGSIGCNKLFEYMAAGIPIISSANVEWRKIIDRYNCGVCVNPDDIDDIANAINLLLNNPDLAKTLGDNSRLAAEQEFNWNTQEKVLLSMYDDLIKTQNML